MFDEEEYAEFHKRLKNQIEGVPIKQRFQPALDYYNELSGFVETNINAVMHHRIALYGPPCEKCGKPYRTSKASFCAACGNKRPDYTNE